MLRSSRRTVTDAFLMAMLALLSAPLTSEVVAEPGADHAQAAVCRFRFTYAGTIDGVTPGAPARVWLPLATDRFGQKIVEVEFSPPAEFRRTRERRFGNELLYFEAEADAAGEISFGVEYLVERKELTPREAELVSPEDRRLYLSESRFVPRNPELLARLLPQQQSHLSARDLARSLYDAVEKRMRYEKPEGGAWGRGDAVWACDSGYGNCTDYHSLFLAAGYAAGVPGRFEIGFLLPTGERSGPVAGYHCWAFFAADGRWIPVDISEADKQPEKKDYYFGNLTADRVTFSVGRDLQLDPPPAETEPVNFLVYPYVEVDGRRHTSFAPKFRFADVP